MKISLVTDIGQKRSNNQDFINKFDNKNGITLVILAWVVIVQEILLAK